MTIEPLEPSGTGVEFVTTAPNAARTFHSAKRQQSEGEWTLRPLARSRPGKWSVLEDLFAKLRGDPQAGCVFVSMTGMTELKLLHGRARRRGDAGALRLDLAESAALRQAFEDTFVALAGGDWDAAAGYLLRLDPVVIDEERLVEQVDQRISYLVYRPDGRPFAAEEVRLKLADLVDDRLGRRIGAEDLWALLSASGFAHRD